MLNYPILPNEPQRLNALYDYGILDTISEVEYDSITKIAATICNVQASLITFLDRDRQWFKSAFGFPIKQTPRSLSFCNYTITDPDNVLVVSDMRDDERFSANPLVTGEPNAVFYAGAPLVTPDGFALGSICVLDGNVQELTADQKEALQGLATQVMTRLELQKKVNDLRQTESRLKHANNNLKNFAKLVSHDMKTPLANIMLVSKSFKNRYAKDIDNDGGEFLDLINTSAKEMLVFIDDILDQSERIAEGTNNSTSNPEIILRKVLSMIVVPEDISISIKGQFPLVAIDNTSLQQISQNIITNAIKYNDKETGSIEITCKADNLNCRIFFDDNGSGISEENLSKIFSDGQTLDKTDRFGNKGTGIGLAAVKEIVENAGGKIKVTSEEGEGSIFEVVLPIAS